MDENTNTNENINVNQENQEVNQDTENSNIEQELTFSQADVDKRVSDAIKKREEKLRAEFELSLEEKLNSKLEEQKRLSKLSEEERKQEEFNNRLKEVEARELKLNNMQLKNDFIKELANENLPTEAVDLLISESDTNAEDALKKLNSFKDIIAKANEMYLKEKLGENSAQPQSGKTAELTSDDFIKMSAEEKMKLYRENKALYDSLEEKALNR